MRIVDRATFLALPAGTVFAKFGPPGGQSKDCFDFNFDDLSIKCDQGGPDFVVQELVPWLAGAEDSGEYFDALHELATVGGDRALDYDMAGRDGMFDKRQQFAVWSKDDVDRLIDRLMEARTEAFGKREGN